MPATTGRMGFLMYESRGDQSTHCIAHQKHGHDPLGNGDAGHFDTRPLRVRDVHETRARGLSRGPAGDRSCGGQMGHASS